MTRRNRRHVVRETRPLLRWRVLRDGVELGDVSAYSWFDAVQTARLYWSGDLVVEVMC